MCCENEVENKCMPYSDACPIVAQVFAAIAFGCITAGVYFFMWGSIFASGDSLDEFLIYIYVYWAAVVLSFATFIMAMVSCCCSFSKCGFIAMGVMLLLTGTMVAVLSIIVMAGVAAWKEDCEAGQASVWGVDVNTYEYNYNDDPYGYGNNDDIYTSTCNVDGTGAIYGVSITGAVLAIIGAILFLAFACSSRLQTAIDKLKAEQGKEPGQAAVAQPVSSGPVPAKAY
jgi:hypothetical protein